MGRAGVALLLAFGLAGCGHTPGAGQPGDPATHASPAVGGCAQARWQAETAPVINKRQGQDALDSYDIGNGEGHNPCP